MYTVLYTVQENAQKTGVV